MDETYNRHNLKATKQEQRPVVIDNNYRSTADNVNTSVVLIWEATDKDSMDQINFHTLMINT